jgi:HEAT repeat protein
MTFAEGLEKSEISDLLDVLGNNPNGIDSAGGLPQFFSEKNITHIYLDEKVYIARDKNQQILADLNITDDQIVAFLMQTHPELTADPQKIKDMAKDPEWLLQAFQAGLSQTMAQKGTLSNLELSESLTNMIVLLDKVAAPLDHSAQEKLSQHIGKSIATIDPDITRQIMAQNIESLFGGMLIQYIASELNGVKTGGSGTSDESGESGGASGEYKAYQNQQLFFNLEDRIEMLLKDDKRTILDAPMMEALPKIVEKLVAKKQQEAIDTIINRLLENMFCENADVRGQAAQALSEVIENLPSEQKPLLIEKLSGKLLEWVKQETLATPGYEKICHYLQSLVQDFIYRGHFSECIPILDVFNDIRAGNVEKNETIHKISIEVIRNIASEDNLTYIFNIFNANEQSNQIEAGELLVRLGDMAMNRLLDILQEKVDSNERVRIMRLIIGVGSRAIPFVRSRITDNTPWYYLRNLAYLLGHIGNEESAIALQPLLMHENSKVRQEALKSLQRTGGKERGILLLSVLHEADEKSKLSIVEAIGNAKSSEAVADLLDILKARPLIVSALRNDLEEKICIALGAIGSTEAIPMLTEIADSKSFLRIRSYPEKVRHAAGKSLLAITKKKSETKSSNQ